MQEKIPYKYIIHTVVGSKKYLLHHLSYLLVVVLPDILYLKMVCRKEPKGEQRN